MLKIQRIRAGASCRVETSHFFYSITIVQYSLSQHTKTKTLLTNKEATQLLKELYSTKKNTQQLNEKKNNEQIAQNALNIYYSIIDKKKNKFVINTFVKVLISCKEYNKIYKIWNDIKYINDIGYIQLLKLCVESKPIDIDKCIEILKWIKTRKYKLKEFEIIDFSVYTSKLISISYKDLDRLKLIYSLIKDTNDLFIKTSLINAFGKCNEIQIAQSIFNSMNINNLDIISINTMMTVYLNNNKYYQCLQLYDNKLFKNKIDDTSHLLAIKSCLNIGDYDKGKNIIYNNINNNKDILSIELKNTLIEFYGICGDITNAFKIFHNIKDNKKDVFAISNIMKACINNNLNNEALAIYNTYNNINDNVSHLFGLKACINLNDIEKGKQIHKNINNKPSIELLSALINFYGYFGQVIEAKKIFKSIKKLNSTLFGSMMKVFIDNNMNEKALKLYDKLYKELSNEITDLLAIKACQNCNEYEKGHGILMKYHLNNNNNFNFTKELKCAGVDFYGYFGDIINAKELFNLINKKDVIGIGCMMKAYINNNNYKNALKLYDKYENIQNDILHLQAINSCIKINNFKKGQEIIYKNKLKNNNYCKNIKIKTALIDFYGQFGDLDSSLKIYKNILIINAMCINSMMTAFINNKQYKNALDLYCKETNKEILNDTSHLLAIKICIDTNNQKKWNEIKSNIINNNQQSIKLNNSLIDCYGYFGDIDNSIKIFNSLKIKDTVSINSIMTVLNNNNMNKITLEIYNKYKLLQDDISHVLAIKACNNLKDYEKGKKIHSDIILLNNDINKNNNHLKSALIDLYGNCQQIDISLNIFNSIPINDLNIICINCMMEAYYKNNKYLQCIQLYKNIKKMKIKNKNLIPDSVCYAILFKACTHGSYIQFAQKIYKKLKDDNDDILKQVNIIQHLINMFGKFGMIKECKEIFNKYEWKNNNDNDNMIIWNAMINAYGINGDIISVKQMYDEMKTDKIGLIPNLTTFILLLNAYSHCGDIETAKKIYNNDIIDIDIKYDEYIITNIINCYSKNGLLINAYDLIKEYEQITQNVATEIMWTSILNGCCKHNDKIIANQVYQEMCKRFENIKHENNTVSSLMSNLMS